MVDPESPEQLVAVHRALETLAAQDSDLVEVVDLACFAGLSSDEIAELTGTTVRTVQRRMQRAQAWLTSMLQDG